MGVMFTEFQGRSILGQGVEIHAEKIYRELTADIVELIFIFPVIPFWVCLVHFLQIVEIVKALGVDKFMEDEVLPLFFRCQCLTAMGTPQGKLLSEAVFIWRKVCIAYLAFQLSGLAVIAVKIRLRGATGGAGAVFQDVTFFTVGDRFILSWYRRSK